MNEKTFSMKETCEMTGLSYDTLKFYCKQGIIPNVKRDKNNYRIFDENNIGWIKNLLCLKRCGMSNKEIKEYMNLCILGKSTIPERKRILKKKQENLKEEMQKIQDSIDFINYKQTFYDDVLNNKVVYYSYLTKY